MIWLWVTILVMLGSWIVWRLLNRVVNIPCPFWLDWLMESPYQKWILDAQTTVDRAQLSEGQKVLDLGCGSGRISIEIAKILGKSGSLVCADLQDGMLKKLKERFKKDHIDGVELLRGDVNDIDFTSRKFDRIILVMLVGEVSDRKALFLRLTELVEEDGLISISEVFPDPHYQTQKSIKHMAHEAGLHVADNYGNFWAHTTNLSR